MNLSNIQPLTPQDYKDLPLVWKPQEIENASLFIVKVPSGVEQLSRPDYQNLMGLRLQWLIGQWMETTGDNQPQTHQLLTQALNVLSLQEPPELYEDSQTKELQPLWWWTQEWAETLLLCNETFWTKLQLSQINFPIQIAPQPQPQWMEEHDTIPLADWLSELTSGMN